MNDIPELLPADLILVGGDWWMAKLIRWFTRHRGETPTKVHHVAGIVESDPFLPDTKISEALLTVKKSRYEDGDKDDKYYEIWRHRFLTQEERNEIANKVNEYTFAFYGGGKLLFHALDGLMGKIFGKEIYGFRSILRINRYPICSGLWAYSYYDVLHYEFDAPYYVVSPDDIHDHVINNPNGELVYKKGNT